MDDSVFIGPIIHPGYVQPQIINHAENLTKLNSIFSVQSSLSAVQGHTGHRLKTLIETERIFWGP